MLNSQEKNNEELNKEYKTNLYQNETNYSIKLTKAEEKLQIFAKSKKSFSEEIYEFSNKYSLKQLQITNKYFSKFESIEDVCSDLDNLLKLKIVIEEENGKTLILKIPTSIDKSSGEIIFKLIKTKKVKKVVHSPEKLKENNKINNKYEHNLKSINENGNNNELLLGNINDLTIRLKNLEKKEAEKEKKINKLKEEIKNYQEKIENNYKYPIYSPVAGGNDIQINLADDKNNQIGQILKQKNEEKDDINLEDEKETNIKKGKKKKNNELEDINTDIKNEKKNKSKIKNQDDNSDDDDNFSESQKKNKKKRKSSHSSEEISEKEIDNNLSNGKEEPEENKSLKIVLKNKKGNLKKSYYDLLISGFPNIEREDLRQYINSRIFYTIKELQMVKRQITKGNKNMHAYFDLLYRATVDGDAETAINSTCGAKYPQITLFLTDEGARFGVYVDKEGKKSFFSREVTYKEKPGTSFLFSLNSLKIYEIQKGELATDNRTEKLCFGRTYRYNNNESNWLIYVPREEFLGVELLFGDKESTFGDIKPNEIIGSLNTYHLIDVEIFQVMIDIDKNEINDNQKNDDYKNDIQEKENKKKKKEKKEKINNNDETISGEKIEEDHGKEDEDEDGDIKISRKNKKVIGVVSNINNDNNDSD